MATVVVLGAGISGHTAATLLKRKLGRRHEVVVVSPSDQYQWIPSNIWVGVGRMKPEQVRFALPPVYRKLGVVFHQAKALSLHPEGGTGHAKPFVRAEYTTGENLGQSLDVEYDFLINATGPRLNFEATPGLGPHGGFTQSVCSTPHAIQSWENLQKTMALLEQGKPQEIVIGTGHPTATCQGAAFEYILNVAFELQTRGLAHLAKLTWISNEYEMGDFGMGGAFIRRGGYVTPTKVFTESIFAEYGIRWIKRAGVKKVEAGQIHYESLDGSTASIPFDFAMLIPAFAGQPLKAFDKEGGDITAKLFAPSGFMKVDADYTQRPFEEWSVKDWPSTYQSPAYKNLFATGIAFAPPHPIAKPMTSPNGTAIFPAPPRTGMPSGVMGKVVAQNIVHWILRNDESLRHRASMGHMGAACVVSAGFGALSGKAATMTVFPVVPDWEKYPEWGRDISYTVGEAGLAGHWIKLLLHHMFLYKAKLRPLWWMIPE